jgi:hypothetical protein
MHSTLAEPAPYSDMLFPLRGRGRYGLNLKDGLQQVLDHLALVLLSSCLDVADLGLGLLAGLILGLLVALGVLCLELLELVLLGLAVGIYFFLGFVSGLAYSLGSELSGLLDYLGSLSLGIEQGLNAC